MGFFFAMQFNKLVHMRNKNCVFLIAKDMFLLQSHNLIDFKKLLKSNAKIRYMH